MTNSARWRVAPWLLLAAAAGLLVLGLVYAGRGGAQRPSAASPARAEGDGAEHRYADPASCAGCHSEIANTYALTGMARSLSRIELAADQRFRGALESLVAALRELP